jgi:hypothetical protein
MPANLRWNVGYRKSKLLRGINRFCITVERVLRKPIHKSPRPFLQRVRGRSAKNSMCDNLRAIALGHHCRGSGKQHHQRQGRSTDFK